MKMTKTIKLSIILVIVLSVDFAARAQFYAGKFRHKPGLAEFDHVIVMSDAVRQNTGTVTAVKAFDIYGDLWHSRVAYPEGEEVLMLKQSFKKEKKLGSIYKLSLDRNGEELHYYLIGYRDQEHSERFFLVEEFYHGPSDVVPVEVNALLWSQAEI